jgi:hypothetical protein
VQKLEIQLKKRNMNTYEVMDNKFISKHPGCYDNIRKDTPSWDIGSDNEIRRNIFGMAVD